MSGRLRAHAKVASSLSAFLRNSRGLSPILGMLILLATGIAVSLASATWMQSMAYSLMEQEELQIEGLYFYEARDSAFPNLPEEEVTGTYQNVVIEESSDIKITGSFNNVTVVGKTHNIDYVGGNNNLTLVSPGTILIDVTNPDIVLNQIPGGWFLTAQEPQGRPILRGDIYLNALGSKEKKVYILGGQVVFCDSSYSAVAAIVKNTGTCSVEITRVHLKWELVTAKPVPCKVRANSEVTISILCTWVEGGIYRISIVTSKGNMFNFAEVAE